MSLENTALETEDEEFVDELKPGTKLMHGQYTIEDFLAAGGFGITYLARDSLNRQVVNKECFPGSFCRRQNHSVTPRSRAHQNELKSIVRLFSQEAMALAKANHPNIVGVHLVFEENNTAYMALDYVQGRDLLEILQDDPDSLKPNLVEGYLVKVLDAIKHIHDMEILHRDISPDNIIINEQGEPILIDFGAARESTNEQVTRMLSALRVVKDGYSPQEFYIAGSDQPPSCDLYSLAASFYHIITRELPPDSQWRLSARAAGDEDPYVSLGEKTSDYPKTFVVALDKAMATLPRERMQSAEEWIQYLQGNAPTSTATKPVAGATSIKGPSGKKAFLPVLLGTTALAAAAGAGFFFISSGGSEAPSGVTEATAPVVAVETSVPAPTPEVVAPVETVVAPEPDVRQPIETVTAPDVANLPPVFLPPVVSDPEVAAVDEIVEDAPVVVDSAPIIIEVPPVLAPVVEPVEEVVVAVPDLPAIENVALEIAEPPVPAVEEVTDFVVPPIIAALPDQVLAPLPRPLRTVEITVAEIEDAQPELDTVAPAAPLLKPVVVAEPDPVVEPEPVVVAEVAPEVVPADGESASTGVDFFVNMAKSQPDLVSARAPRTETPSVQPTPAAPVETVAAPTASTEPAPVGPTPIDAASAIASGFAPILPFELSFWQPGLVVGISDNGPDWLAGNARIVSVNGQPIETNDEIVSLIRTAAPQESADSFVITLGVESALTGAVDERPLAISKEKDVLLANGLRFSVRETDAGWVTQVIDAPSSTPFKPGDTLVSYATTWENLDGPNSLQTILQREMESGNSSFSFAVNRNGELLVEAFSLAAVGN